MKLSSLANDLLKYMVKSYSKDHNCRFSLDNLQTAFQDQDRNFISDALYLLDKDGLVSVFNADDEAYMTTLLPNAIRDMEENTLIKKLYSCAKEIKEWL